MKTKIGLLLLISSLTSALETEVIVTKEGSCRGKDSIRDGAVVTLDYDGFIEDRTGNAGERFTSTYQQSDPFKFTLGQNEVIKGLEQVRITKE